MPTIPSNLDYLPLPNAARTELRRLLANHRGWYSYRARHNLRAQTMTRVDWFAAALAHDIDVEKFILDYFERTGAQMRRCRHLDGTVEQRKKIDFWS